MFETKLRAANYEAATILVDVIMATVPNVSAHVEMSPFDDRTYNVVLRTDGMR